MDSKAIIHHSGPPLGFAFEVVGPCGKYRAKEITIVRVPSGLYSFSLERPGSNPRDRDIKAPESGKLRSVAAMETSRTAGRKVRVASRPFSAQSDFALPLDRSDRSHDSHSVANVSAIFVESPFTCYT